MARIARFHSCKVLVCLCLLACVGLGFSKAAGIDAAPTSASGIDDRLTVETNIYLRILLDRALGGPPPGTGERSFVVVGSTTDPQLASWWISGPGWARFDLRKRVPDGGESVIKDFLRVTREWRDLDRAFGADTRVTVVTSARLAEIFHETDGWAHFYSTFPNATGYTEFSRVGFDETGAEALVYIGHHYGLLGGTGRFVLLRRDGTQWNIVRWYLVWES